LEMWGMFEIACFAALASGIAMSSYLLEPYRRQLRQTHSASFFEQIKEIREGITLRPQFYAFLMLSTKTYPI
nr:MFS transporter [Vibrio cholerae O1]